VCVCVDGALGLAFLTEMKLLSAGPV